MGSFGADKYTNTQREVLESLVVKKEININSYFSQMDLDSSHTYPKTCEGDLLFRPTHAAAPIEVERQVEMAVIVVVARRLTEVVTKKAKTPRPFLLFSSSNSWFASIS